MQTPDIGTPVIEIRNLHKSYGNLEVVKKNFSLVILGIIVVSTLPAVFEIAREWRKARLARPNDAR